MNFRATLLFRASRYVVRYVFEVFRTALWSEKNPIYAKDIKKLRALRNKHKDKPCFIIGNGPSLNEMDLNLMSGAVTIACNSFYLKHIELTFVPTYYTVEDPLPAEDNRNEISGLKGTTKIIPWDLKHLIKRDENTIYCNFLRSYMRPGNPDFPCFSFDFLNRVYWGGTVTYFNIQLAAYLGCSPIYLLGVDLSYSLPSSLLHSGAVLTSTEDDPNHFDPNYFGKGKRWHLPEVERMQKSFEKAYLKLNARGVSLLNAGVGGNLKVIPRVDYKQLFKLE